MASSIRQQIVDAFLARLRTIAKPTFKTDVGAKNVYEWREYSQAKPTTGVSLNVRDRDAEVNLTHGSDIHDLEFEIDCFAAGATSPTVLRELLADVVQAIAVDKFFGGLVQNTFILGQELEAEHETMRLLSAQIRIMCQYTTNHLDPYV